MADPTYPLFHILSFLGFFISVVPLSWHIQAWNTATCFYMIWTALACLNLFINSLVWANDVVDRAPVWCDISIRILLGASVGIPASSLAITRKLHGFARANAATLKNFGEQKWKGVLIDTLLCVVFPLVFIAWQYIVQGHRYDIFEGIGCYPALYNTPLTFVLTYMWPIVLGLISAVYGGLAFRGFMQRRALLTELFQQGSHKSLTMDRYLRLMALAAVEIVLTVPLGTLILCVDAIYFPVYPWISWDHTHEDYGRVDQYPAVLWRAVGPMAVFSVEFTRWAPILCALVFFAFFGFTVEARRNYAGVLSGVGSRLGVQRASATPSKESFNLNSFKFRSSSSTLDQSTSGLKKKSLVDTV